MFARAPADIYIYVYLAITNGTLDHLTTLPQAVSRFFNSISLFLIFFSVLALKALILMTGRFLKASTNPQYTVSEINDYPTTTNAVQVATTLIYACKHPDTFSRE